MDFALDFFSIVPMRMSMIRKSSQKPQFLQYQMSAFVLPFACVGKW